SNCLVDGDLLASRRAASAPGSLRQGARDGGTRVELSAGQPTLRATHGSPLAACGDIEGSRRTLVELLSLRASTYVSARAIASIFLALGERQEALTWLERAVEERAVDLLSPGRPDVGLCS